MIPCARSHAAVSVDASTGRIDRLNRTIRPWRPADALTFPRPGRPAAPGDQPPRYTPALGGRSASDDQSGDESGNGDHNASGGDDNAGGGDDNGQGDDENAQNCTMANLSHGAFVRGAELRISSAGAVWDKVDLIH